MTFALRDAPQGHELYQELQGLIGTLKGQTKWSAPIDHIGLTSNSRFAQITRNLGTGGHQQWQKSTDGSEAAAIVDTGFRTTAGTFSGNVTITGTLGVTGATTLSTLLTSGLATLNSASVTNNVTIGGTLGVTGATSLSTLSTSGLATLNSASVTTTLGVTGATTLTGALAANGGTTTTTLTATGTWALGNENTDTGTVIGVNTFRNAANTATQLYVDAGNNRVIIGSSTALGSDTTPNLQVVGRLYVAPDGGGNDQSLFLRHNTGAVGQFSLGATNSATPDLIFKNNAGTQMGRMTNAGLLIVGTATAAVGTAGAADVQCQDLWLVDGSNYRRLLANGTAFQITENAGTGVHLTIDSSGTLTVPDLQTDADISIAGTGTTITFSGTSQTQTTVGGAGGASALPATPRGYIKVVVSGTSRVLPFYDAS